MAPRALGALLALVAAIAFVVSIVSSAWWAGPPTVNGRESHKKEVRIGLLGATGCNTGGDGSCEPLPIGSTLDIASKIELGAVALAALLALLMAISAWRVGDGRKGLARASMIVALVAAAGGVAVLLLGPDIKASQDVGAPIGWGTFVFAGGVIANLVASAITRKVEPEPLRLKPSLPHMAAAQQQPPSNVREMLRNDHDGLRPAQLGPEPMIGSGPVAAIPPSAPRESVPLIGGAPQLRPLYENQGFVPSPPTPALPVRAPTPIPQSMVRQYTGQNTPMPERADTVGVAPPPPATLAAASIPAPPRVKGPSVAPPPRPQSPSVPPARPQSPSVPPPPRTTSPSKPAPLPSPGDPLGPPVDPFARTAPNDQSAALGPPPPPNPQRAALGPPRAKPEVRAKPPSISPPSKPEVRAKPPSIAPPTKTAPLMVPPSKPAGPPRSAPLATPPTDTPPTARDSSTRTPRAGTVLGPGTDPSLTALPRSMAPVSSVEKRPSQPTIAHAVPPMPSDDNIAAPSRRAATEADDRLETAMRPTDYISAVEVDAESTVASEPPRSPADTSPSGNPSVGDVTDTAQPLADELAAQQHDGTDTTDPSRNTDEPYARGPNHTPIPTHKPAPAVQVPISTAPSTLPPPKATQSTASGPTPACPQCEAPMAWVEEHLRFYCKSCRMYF